MNVFMMTRHVSILRQQLRALRRVKRYVMNAFSTWKTGLSWSLVSVVHMYAPEIIILNGGAAPAAHYSLDEIHTHVNHRTFRNLVGEEIRIKLSDTTTFSALFGARALAWEPLDRG